MSRDINYKSLAESELERDIRRLEERNKKAQTFKVFNMETSNASSNIDFAARIGLITGAQELNYQRRVAALREQQSEFERMERNETRDIVNDTENPRERSARYRAMDDYNRQIAEERSKVKDNSVLSPSVPAIGNAEARNK